MKISKSARRFQVSARAISESGEPSRAIGLMSGRAMMAPHAGETVTHKNQIIILVTTIAMRCPGADRDSGARRAASRDRFCRATSSVRRLLCPDLIPIGVLGDDSGDARHRADRLGDGLHVDRARKDVTVTLLGGGQSHAVYPRRSGLLSRHGDEARRIRCRRTKKPNARCCPRSPGLRWSRPPIRPCGSHSIAPSPSPIDRHSATPRRSSS